MSILNSTIYNLNNIIKSCDVKDKDTFRFVRLKVNTDSNAAVFGLSLKCADYQPTFGAVQDQVISLLIAKNRFNAETNNDRYKFHVGAKGNFSAHFVSAYVSDFIDQTDGLHFNDKLLCAVQEIIDLATNISEMDVTGINGVVLNGSQLLLLSNIQILSLIDGIKQAAVEILENNSDKTTPAKNALQKVMFLHNIGVIDFLKEKYKASPNKVATILSVFTDEKSNTIQRNISDIITGNKAKNNPYNSNENKVWLSNTKRKLKIE